MTKRGVHRKDDVFGVSRHVPLNYVERERVDNKLREVLERGKHVIIYGSSKQGKTCLRRKNLVDDSYILIQCQPGWGMDRVAEAVLKKAGYEVTTSTEKTIENRSKLFAKLSSGLASLGLISATAEAGSELESSEAIRVAKQGFPIDASDPNDLVEALRAIGFRKWIVLEDFHYLPQETQKAYSSYLKAIHELSELCFVIVAVWREENRLVFMNGDLTGRVVSVDADNWSEKELSEVVTTGAKLLNVDVDSEFVADLVRNCLGSVYIVQEVCSRLCDDFEISESQTEKMVIAPSKEASKYIDEVVDESGSRYRAFLDTFAEGHGDTELSMYKWLLHPIICADLEQLEAGFTYKEIRAHLKAHHPRQSALNTGNISQALANVSSVQAKKEIKPFVLDYDNTNKRLSVVERGFTIWLTRQAKKELLDELEFTSIV